jgi:hypothetical protein
VDLNHIEDVDICVRLYHYFASCSFLFPDLGDCAMEVATAAQTSGEVILRFEQIPCDQKENALNNVTKN